MIGTKQLGYIVALAGASLALPFFLFAPDAFRAISEIPPALAGLVSIGAGGLLLFLSWKTFRLSGGHARTLALLGIASVFGATVGLKGTDPEWATIGPTIVQFVAGLIVAIGGWKISQASERQ